MIIDTLSGKGTPWCPVCHTEVIEEGFFCSEECWHHLHLILQDQGSIVEMNYRPLWEQPWHGRNTPTA